MSRANPTHIFGGAPLDRAAERRADERWIAERLSSPASRAIAFREGRLLVALVEGVSGGGDLELVYLPAGEALALSTGEPLFLGLLGETAVFAVDADREGAPGLDGGRGAFEELRPAAVRLSGPEAAIAGTAASLFNWRARHRFCAACGGATRDAAWGWRRVCDACGAEHFPRVDPAVIMLVVAGDRCLLARGAGWPAGRFALLAGFVEPGESIEEACAREVREEAGLVATRVTYHSSQPWPFPSSMMVGLFAEVAEARSTPDGVEVEEVRWVDRDEARAVLEGRHPEIFAPGRLGIGRHLLEVWVEGDEVLGRG